MAHSYKNIDLSILDEPKKDFATRLRENQIGILGTIAIHLFIAILVVASNINRTEKKIKQQQILVDFEAEKSFDLKDKLQEAEKQKDQLIKDLVASSMAHDIKNIPVNVSAEKSSNLNADNYLKNFKEQIGVKDPEPTKYDDKGDLNVEKEQQKEEKPPEKSQYQGPTTIYYDLKGRTHRYLHVPVYMCQESGKVALNIKVDQQGNVVSAIINPSASGTLEECLTQAAIKSALKSKFSVNTSSPIRQEGSITYYFRAQ